MEGPSIVRTVHKLAIAGQQAGFSLEQMIELLNAGISVVTLLHLIEVRLAYQGQPAQPATAHSSRWVM
jgi:hypothetical protein